MNNPFKKNNNNQLLENIFFDLQTIRNKYDHFALCPTPTDYSWMGVNIATFSLFPSNTFQIPQYYSESVFTDKQFKIIVEFLNSLDFNQIIFSGFPPYFSNFIEKLNNSTKLKVIYHGFFSELASNPKQIQSYSQIIRLAKNNKISTIAFIKAGMGKTVSRLNNINCVDLVLPTHLKGEIKQKPSDKINIGCLVNNSSRKNLHNQINAALMIENAVVHVFENKDLDYLPEERIVKHNLMNHASFIQLLGSMHINLHVTYSESWGQVLSESIAQGVPCLSAYTSAFFDYNQVLKEHLIVAGFDDSWHIYKQIEHVIENYDMISTECLKYSKQLNDLAQEKIQHFLDA